MKLLVGFQTLLIHSLRETSVIKIQLKSIPNNFTTQTCFVGNFSIDGIPPGSYIIKAWHEALGIMEKQVTITEGDISALDFVIKPRGR